MKRQISITLIATMIFLAILPLLNINAQIIEENKHWSREEVKENEIISIEFPYEIDLEYIDVPEGMEYMGYEDGHHNFKALEDLEQVEGNLYYRKEIKQDIIEKESGEANLNGKPSEGTGVQINWGEFNLGKNAWELDNNIITFAIRINLEDYYDNDYIIVKDIPSDNLSLDSKITVNKLNQRDGKVENDGVVHYELIENDDNGFAIKVPVDKSTLVYDIVYNMKNTGGTYNNEYKVYALDEWENITSNASVNGNIKSGQTIHLKTIWKNASGRVIEPSDVNVQITDGNNEDIFVSLDRSNNWEATITNLDKNVNYEILKPGFNPEDFKVEVELKSEKDNEKSYEIIITLINEYDEAKNKPSIHLNMLWKNELGEEINPKYNEVKVQITDGEKEHTTVRLNDYNNWQTVITDLEEGIEYEIIKPGLDKESFNVDIQFVGEENNQKKYDIIATLINEEGLDNNNCEDQDNKDQDNKDQDNKDQDNEDQGNNNSSDNNIVDKENEKPGNPDNSDKNKKPNESINKDKNELENQDGSKTDNKENTINKEEVEEKELKTASRVVVKNKDKKERDFNKRNESNIDNEDSKDNNINNVKGDRIVKDSKDNNVDNHIDSNIDNNKAAPQTGDNFNVVGNLFIVVISILGLYIINKIGKLESRR